MKSTIVEISNHNVTLAEYDWPMAHDRAVEIDQYWKHRISAQPHLFNGEMCLLRDWSVKNGALFGSCFITNYKTFLWWREHDRPDRNVFDFFGAAAVHTRENWLILGHMAEHTASRGLFYLPCGSPIPSDITAGKLDLDGSLIRETLEETGIGLVREQLGSALLINDGARLVYVRSVRLNATAFSLSADVTKFITNQINPELESIKIVKGRNDLDEDKMPPFVAIYVRYALA